MEQKIRSRWWKPEDLDRCLCPIRDSNQGTDFFRAELKWLREAVTALDFGLLMGRECEVRLPSKDEESDFELRLDAEVLKFQAVEVLDKERTRRGSPAYFSRTETIDFLREFNVAIDGIAAEAKRKALRMCGVGVHLVLRLNLWVPDLRVEDAVELVAPWSDRFLGVWLLDPGTLLAQLTPSLTVFYKEPEPLKMTQAEGERLLARVFEGRKY